MSPLILILTVACVMLGMGLLAVLAWFISTAYLYYVERRLARRKGLCRELIGEVAARDRVYDRLGLVAGWLAPHARLGFREGTVPAHG